jgi:hypothetical protein
MIKSYKDILIEGMERAQKGEIPSLPFSFPLLSTIIDIRKKVYSLIFAGSGVGKSTLVQNMFILDPVEHVIDEVKKGTKKFDVKIIYFSMERSKEFTLYKWMCRKIFRETGVLITLDKIYKMKGQSMSEYELKVFNSYLWYIDEIEKYVDIIEGKQNPVSIDIYVKDYAKKNGTIFKKDEYHSEYIENNPSLVTIIIIDHQSLITTTKDYPTTKQAIDAVSGQLQNYRDFYHFSPVMVAQMNRVLSGYINSKNNNELSPDPSQIADSSTPERDADLVISLFEPIRFKTNCDTGHDAEELIDGLIKRYRSFKIHKNSYGADELSVGLCLYGETGDFKELPGDKEMKDGNLYDLYRSGEAFKNKKSL